MWRGCSLSCFNVIYCLSLGGLLFGDKPNQFHVAEMDGFFRRQLLRSVFSQSFLLLSASNGGGERSVSMPVDRCFSRAAIKSTAANNVVWLSNRSSTRSNRSGSSVVTSRVFGSICSGVFLDFCHGNRDTVASQYQAASVGGKGFWLVASSLSFYPVEHDAAADVVWFLGSEPFYFWSNYDTWSE